MIGIASRGWAFRGALAFAAAILAACGGGGGGGAADAPGGGVVTPPAPPAPTFAGWSNELKPGATVAVAGHQQEYYLTTGPSAVRDGVYTETLGADGKTSEIRIRTASGDAIWSLANGDRVPSRSTDRLASAILFSSATDGSRIIGIQNTAVMQWEYQNYGVWKLGSAISPFSAGGGSYGAVSPASAVPQTGAATFGGAYTAVMVFPNGSNEMTAGAMTFKVDFAGRTVGVDTFNVPALGGLPASGSPEVNGTLNYTVGQNRFTGVLTVRGTTLSGTGAGRFYGPSAQELGGTFYLAPTDSATNPQRMIGAFGGKRVP